MSKPLVLTLPKQPGVPGSAGDAAGKADALGGHQPALSPRLIMGLGAGLQGLGTTAGAAQDAAAVLHGLEDNDLMAGEDQEDDMHAVESMLGRIMAKRKADTRVKQEQLVQDALAALTKSADGLKAAVAKDAKDSGSSARSAASKVEANLNATMKAMEQCTEKYQQEMHTLWKKYGEQYEQLSRVKQEAKAATERRKAAAKRKISALQADANKMIAETEGRISKMQKTKLPNVLQMLQSLYENP